jgi:hypothetical protein
LAIWLLRHSVWVQKAFSDAAPNVTHDKGGHMYIGLGTLVVVLVIVMIISFIRRA